MMRMIKFYPDLPVPRLGYILADTLALLWVAACVWLGVHVYDAVMLLAVIANGIVATGQQLGVGLSNVQGSVAGLPVVGSGLHDALGSLSGIPGSIIAQGQADLDAIQRLALVLGVSIGGAPLVVMLLRFIPWRIAKTRGFRNLDHLLRQPGARAVSTTMQVLAGRAIYTLPYDELLRYSPDPIAEWREGRYYNLARATMAVEGLDVRGYLHRMEGVALPEEPTPRTPERVYHRPMLEEGDIPVHGDE